MNDRDILRLFALLLAHSAQVMNTKVLNTKVEQMESFVFIVLLLLAIC